MNVRRQSVLALALATLSLGAGTAANADQQRRLRPEVQLLVQTVTEKLQAAADTLGLTPEQRTKFRETQSSFAPKYQALRTERRQLLQSELTALNEALTPQQRETAKNWIEDRLEDPKPAAEKLAWRPASNLRESVAERLEAAADKLGLTPEQRQQIRKAHSGFAEKYRAQRAARQELVEAEFKALSEILTPEQRQKAREAIEENVVRAALIETVADRLETAADKLNLTAEQRRQIREAAARHAADHKTRCAERRELLQAELAAIGPILTSEQKEKARDFTNDEVVVIDLSAIKVDDQGHADIAELREKVSERLDAAADRMGLTPDQRQKIREAAAPFAEKYQSQRAARQEDRREELQALSAVLTPEQREKVKNFVEERIDVRRIN
jgi:Spy/CpxP family protein refolding chaperone